MRLALGTPFLSRISSRADEITTMTLRMVGLIAGWLFAANAFAFASSSTVEVNRPTDEIWLVSSRGISNPSPCCSSTCGLCYERLTTCGHRMVGSSAEFHAGNLTFPRTFIFVHGNRFECHDAIEYGLRIYRALRCRFSESCPIRLVIWSWPSDSIECQYRIAKDARVKFRRTDGEAWLFANWISEFGSQSQPCLLGYSYGCRVILGALHLLGGGNLDGWYLPRRMCCAVIPVRVAFWAAAVENNATLPRGRFCCAQRIIESGLMTVNRKDPALRRFRCVIPGTWRSALGLTGVRQITTLRNPQVFCHINVTMNIGRRHTIRKYSTSDCILDVTARTLAGGYWRWQFSDFVSQREPDREGASDSQITLDLNRPSKRLDKMFDDCEAKASTSQFARASLVNAIESLKYAVQ